MNPMHYLERELPELVVVIRSVLITLIVFALSVAALFVLRGRALPPLPKAVWAVLIVAMPFMGALAFFIVQPKADAPPDAPLR